jgi:hypothetical protein
MNLTSLNPNNSYSEGSSAISKSSTLFNQC